MQSDGNFKNRQTVLRAALHRKASVVEQALQAAFAQFREGERHYFPKFIDEGFL